MTTERAVLAGGCFWGMQDLIRKLPGVVETRVGYTGGDVENATYRRHGTHAEAIEILFDPAVLSYRQILEFFFQIHDPSTKNRQGNDVGMSYRSAIYTTSPEQKAVAEGTRTTWSCFPTATPATSPGRAGSCPSGRRESQAPPPRLMKSTKARSGVGM